MGAGMATQRRSEGLAGGIDAHRRGLTEVAMAAYRAVIADCGQDANARHISGIAHANLGALLLDLGHSDAAGEFLRQAVSLVPELPEPHFNLGRIMELSGDAATAASHFRDAHHLAPDQPKFLSQLVHAQQKCCDWAALGPRCRRLDHLNGLALASGRPVAESPFKSISRTDDPDVNLAIAKSWAAAIRRRAASGAAPLPPRNMQKSQKIITIGYLSDRFRNAATGHQMASIFGLHDRGCFRIHTYSYGADDGSVYRRRIADGSDRFVDIAGMDDCAVARLIRSHGVDILVDLKGHTHNHRLGISARLPAPVQVAYLGFPGSTGADFFDFILVDPVVAPPQDRGYFTEIPVCLPHCYYPTDHRQPVDPLIPRRSAVGLPEKAFVFCSFNQAFKIDPIMFDCWMAVLRDVPDSVLWLSEGGETVAANLRREAERRDVAPERLVFAGHLPKPQHLARLKLADLCMDTRIYNGHTTTADALWVGVPVVTLKGRHFASRVSASLLTALGIEELITVDLSGYRDLCAALALDHRRLAGLRDKIAAHRRIMPLFDTPKFVRGLERAYRQMWQNHRRSEHSQISSPEAIP